MSADRGSGYPPRGGRDEHLGPQGYRARGRKSDTRVLWAPVVAMGARSVVVADESAERPVQARKRASGARTSTTLEDDGTARGRIDCIAI